MNNIQDISLGDRFMGMLIGPTGSEKTSQAASFWEAYEPWGEYIHFFGFDGIDKLKIIKARFPQAKNIKFTAYGPQNLAQFKDDFAQISEDPKCGMMVLDSYTSFSVTAITYQMYMKGQQALFTFSKAVAGGGKVTKGGIGVPSWDEFNGEAMLATAMIDAFKSSKKDIIVIAHPLIRTEIIEGDTAKKYKSIAAFGPKAADLVPGYFSEIYCLEIQPGASSLERATCFAYTTPRNGFPARTNFPIGDRINLSEKLLYPYLRDTLKQNGIQFLKTVANG